MPYTYGVRAISPGMSGGDCMNRQRLEMWCLGFMSSQKGNYDNAIAYCMMQASMDPEPEFWVEAMTLLVAFRAAGEGRMSSSSRKAVRRAA